MKKFLVAILFLVLGLPLISSLATSQPPSNKRAITRATTDHTSSAAKIVVYFDDGKALVLVVEDNGTAVHTAMVSAPAGKLSDTTEAFVTLTLKSVSLSSLGVVTTPPTPSPSPKVDPKVDPKVSPIGRANSGVLDEGVQTQNGSKTTVLK